MTKILTDLDDSSTYIGVRSMSVSCSKCDRDAIYLRRYTAERLCGVCLVDTTTDRARRTINRLKMLREDDRIVVGVSGGKDSAVLLDVLSRIEQAYPNAELIPVTIDEGIRGYRDQALVTAQDLVKRLDLELVVKSFRDLFGMTLDQMAGDESKENRVGACSYCGVFRRKALNTVAQEMRGSVVATGHNMDDEAQTVIMNIMRGDGKRIGRMNRFRERAVAGFIPRVKPIMELTERDVVAYAHYRELPYHDIPCPYAREAYRNDLRRFLNDMEYKRPGTLTAILHSGETMSSAINSTEHSLEPNACIRCGDPSPSVVCKACEMLDELKKDV
jgi:uncharacterized protein (TIGR00269 family)